MYHVKRYKCFFWNRHWEGRDRRRKRAGDQTEAVADAAAEVERFKGALDTTLKKTEELAADLATRVGEKEAEIMQGHMMLLMDPMLTGEIETAITGESICAE